MDSIASSRHSLLFLSIAVFLIAIVVRVPSCYESFWVDELHSAWTVWGGLGDVFPRAAIGHQSPFYFAALWIWKQIFGDTELALRMSSVMAVAASCVVVTVGVSRWTASVAAGITAGLVLALESNSLFFGTELRPYAFVLLFSALATICFQQLLGLRSRDENRRAWMGLVTATLLAMLCQPTSIGVLAWLLAALSAVWLVRDRRQLLAFSLSDGLLMLAGAAVIFALWRTTLGDAWQLRNNWTSFASANRISQIWEVWDWTWLLLLPLGLLLLAVVATFLRPPASSIHAIVAVTFCLALISLVATTLYWIVSRIEWVPLWHRRYFIAVLPMFACVAGGSVAALERTMPGGKFVALALGLALAIVLPFQQGTLAHLRSYPVALVARGEDWRAAIAWVEARADSEDLVFLDAGLIETRSWRRRPNQQQSEYLTFAAKGPYRISTNVVPVNADRLSQPSSIINDISSRSRGVFMIFRRPKHRIEVSSAESNTQVLGFGNVSVIVQQGAEEGRMPTE